MSSGTHSACLVDKFRFITSPTILRGLAALTAEEIERDVERRAGTNLGEAALAAAVSLETDLPFAESRSERGGGVIKGELHAGECVLVVADIADSGSNALATAACLENKGADVVAILSVVDHGHRAQARLRRAGYAYAALFDVADLDYEGEAD